MALNPIFTLLLVLVVFGWLLGCAGPTHIMSLPSTIPSRKIETQTSITTAPESGKLNTENPIRYNEYCGNTGLFFRHRIFEYGIFGIQADYNMFTSGQLSTSLSYQPISMLIGSIWVGIDPRAGSIGGFETMTGTKNISFGGGYTIIRSVSFIDYSWGGGERLPSTWSRHIVPYGRITGGWNMFELDIRVGKATNAWQPWVWESVFHWKVPGLEL